MKQLIPLILFGIGIGWIAIVIIQAVLSGRRRRKPFTGLYGTTDVVPFNLPIEMSGDIEIIDAQVKNARNQYMMDNIGTLIRNFAAKYKHEKNIDNIVDSLEAYRLKKQDELNAQGGVYEMRALN